jgi:hypothetical protein
MRVFLQESVWYSGDEGASADGLGYQRKLVYAAAGLGWVPTNHLCDGVDLLQSGFFQPRTQAAVGRYVHTHKSIRHLSQQHRDQVLGLLWVFCDDWTDGTTTTEGTQKGERTQLTIALDPHDVFDTLEQIVEHGMPVQAAAGVGELDHVVPICFGQAAQALIGWQVRGGWGQYGSLMLLDMPKVNESLADIKRRAGQRRIEHGCLRAARLDCQLHQFAADALTLVLIADDHQADRGVITLRAGERRTDQATFVLCDKPLRDTLQHGPVFQAVGPLQLHGQGMGRCHIGGRHGAKGIDGALRVGHDRSPWTGRVTGRISPLKVLVSHLPPGLTRGGH